MKSIVDLKLIALIILVVGSILGFGSYAKYGFGQNTNPPLALSTIAPIAPPTNSDVDIKFMVAAAEINNAQYDLGRLAQNHCLRSEICQMGTIMEKKYSDLNGKLKTLARDKSIETPTLPTLTAQQEYKKLSMNVGSYFDKAFCTLIIADLKDAMLTFDRASVECTDANIKIFATNELDELRVQLHNAVTIQQNYRQENPIGLNE